MEKKVLKKVLEKHPERKKHFENYSKVKIERLYTPEDIEALDYLKDLNQYFKFKFIKNLQNAYTSGVYSLVFSSILFIIGASF